MKKLTIDFLKENNLILYEYYRGSYAQGTYIEGVSDKDIGGIFILPQEYMYGLQINYIPQVANETNDIVYYELGRYMELILKNNPTIIESLFVDKKFVVYEHPLMKHIKDIANMYVSKKLIFSTAGFATSQIKKCTSDEKLFSHPVTERKEPLDFCYTSYKQGSTKMVNWLDNHGLKQKYCGLVKMPNMHDMYGVYYDWKAHFEDESCTEIDFALSFLNGFMSDKPVAEQSNKERLINTLLEHFGCSTWDGLQKAIKENITKRLGYSGIVSESGDSMEVRFIQNEFTNKDGVMLNSVAKGIKPICIMSYNADGYAKHLRDYTRYQKWLKERNPVRYENNKDYRYDSKNVMHCFRLLNMATEIAKGEGVHVNRENIDRDFLLSVRNHAYSYEELMEMLKAKEEELDKAIETCTIPDECDANVVNEALITIRKEYYKNGKI